MRIFILGTGRCGTYSFIEACKHISNYTCGHETRAQKFGENRFDYPENHIEADNRLCWHLGDMQRHFSENTLYVHLQRNRDKTAQSYAKRFYKRGGIIDAFCDGIRITPPEKMNANQRLQACYDYIDTVTANIDAFLAHQPQKMTMHLENIQEEFPEFWQKIGAQGNLPVALETFIQKHNTSHENKANALFHLKLFFLRQKQFLFKWLKLNY